MNLRRKKMIRKSFKKGFTLIEIMTVMIIIGMIVGVASLGIAGRVKKARIEATKTQISAFEQAISAFNLDCGFYPDSLDALIKPPSSGKTCKGYPSEGFLSKKEVPSDPWKNAYNYAHPGTHNTDGYDLWSIGPDGEDATSDDISNWATEQPEES